MLLDAFGWRFLLNIRRFPLIFDAFGGFWMEISINKLRFPLRFDAFGGFWMEISIQHLEISIEI